MPLLWLSTAFLLGLLLGEALPAVPAVWGGAALAAAGWGFWQARRRRRPAWQGLIPLPLGVLCAALCLGALRLTLALPGHSALDLSRYNDQGPVRLTAQVSEYPEYRERSTLLRVNARQLALPVDGAASPVRGTALLMLRPGQRFQVGDWLEIEGELQTPAEEEDFSYRDYLAVQGIYTTLSFPRVHFMRADPFSSPLRTALQWVRERAYASLQRSFAQPEAALLSGILLGMDEDLSPALKRAFANTGTAHIIAISGFNIAVLIGLFSKYLFRWLPRPRAAVAALLATAAYTLLVGAQPSVVRAALMGGLSLMAGLIGRRPVGSNTLAFTAALMCLFNPRLPHDVSFQLSFGATLGLILYADPFQQAFIRTAGRWFAPGLVQRLAGPVGEYFLFTLAAQIPTLPILVVRFGRLSLNSLLANPLVLPVQPLVMLAGGAAMIAGMFHPLLGQAVAWLAWPPVTYTLRVVELLGRMPNSSLTLASTAGGFAAFYLAILGLFTFWNRLRATLLRLGGWFARLPALPAAPLLWLLAAGLMAALVGREALAAPDGRLRVTLLGGQAAPAVLLQTPDGKLMLFNGGASSGQLSAALGQRSSLFHHSLDALLITRSEAGGVQALPGGLERFPPRQVWWGGAGTAGSSSAHRQIRRQVQALPARALTAGETWDLGGGVTLQVLADSPQGTLLKLAWDRFHLLIASGAGDWGALPVSAGDTLLWDADGPDELVLPQTAGIFCTRPGPFECISPPAEGWVTLTTDGLKLWVERGP